MEDESPEDPAAPKRRGKYISLGRGGLRTEEDAEEAASEVPAAVLVTPAPVEDKLAGMLAYLLLPAIYFITNDAYKSNRFVRFHSFQSVCMWAGNLMLDVAVSMLVKILPMTVFVLIPVVELTSLLVVLVAVVCMIKAFSKVEFRLPVLGELAASLAFNEN